MNNIATIQNEPYSLDKLAAQRILYSIAKFFFEIRLSISIFLAILGPILILKFDSLKTYTAIFIIFYIIIDYFIIRKIEKGYKNEAARIQELFDTDLFLLPWNEIVAGDKPDKERICFFSIKFKKKRKMDELVNWYSPDIKSLEILPAVAVCQRTNLWWDVSLRGKYFWFLSSVLIALTFFLAIFLSKNLGNLLLILVTLLPFYQAIIEYSKSQYFTIEKTKKLKIITDDLLEKITNGNIDNETLINKLRIIQDEIFHHRESCYFIPDWFYKLFRDYQEEQMNYGAKYYVDKIIGTHK